MPQTGSRHSHSVHISIQLSYDWLPTTSLKGLTFHSCSWSCHLRRNASGCRIKTLSLSARDSGRSTGCGGLLRHLCLLGDHVLCLLHLRLYLSFCHLLLNSVGGFKLNLL